MKQVLKAIKSAKDVVLDAGAYIAGKAGDVQEKLPGPLVLLSYGAVCAYFATGAVFNALQDPAVVPEPAKHPQAVVAFNEAQKMVDSMADLRVLMATKPAERVMIVKEAEVTQKDFFTRFYTDPRLSEQDVVKLADDYNARAGFGWTYQAKSQPLTINEIKFRNECKTYAGSDLKATTETEIKSVGTCMTDAAKIYTAKVHRQREDAGVVSKISGTFALVLGGIGTAVVIGTLGEAANNRIRCRREEEAKNKFSH